MKVILYSTHCPVCKGVEMKLNKRKISYELNTDEEEMKILGLVTAPALSVDGELKIGKKIHEFIDNYRG